MASGSRRAGYYAFRAADAAARWIPPSIATPAAHSLGRALARTMPGRRRMVTRHLRRASAGSLSVPPLSGRALDRAVREAFGSYARYWLEMFQLPHEDPAEIERNIVVAGYEHVEAARAAGNGVIVALPHLGGWEWGGAWLAAVQDERPLVVVEPVEPPELFDWFVEVRSAMGMDVVALAGDTASRVLAALRANAVVCLLSDRDLTGTGVEVEFFGERTTLPAGPATLALRSGAAVLPAAVYFERARRHRAFVRPPLDTTRRGPRLRDDVERITQSLAREFEELVRAAPEQWHLMQPNWPSDLEVT